MNRARLFEIVAPWAGAIAAPALWFAHQQGLGTLIYFNCRAANAWLVIGTGLLALGGLVAAVALSARTWRKRERPPEMDVSRFVALISVLMTAVFGLAIVFQTMAGLMLPGCVK